MSRINTAIDVSPDEVGSGIDAVTPADDIRNITKITMMCQALQEKMKKYYRAGTVDRTTRLNNISTALKGINLGGPDGPYYTINPIIDPMTGVTGCPPGEKLVEDFCMVTT